MLLPKIIIVGTAKCGTTALWYNLDKHPDIHMATKGKESIEMNFWKSTFWKNGLDWYSSRCVEGKINGDKSTAYVNVKMCMREINKYIPDARLIYCVRNPVDRAFSHYQMNHKGTRRVSGPFTYELFMKRYCKFGKYIVHIENNILPYFDKEQLHICVLENMKKDLKGQMKKVFDHVGVYDLGYDSKKIDGNLRKYRTRQEDIALSHSEKFYRVWSQHTEKLTGSLREKCFNIYKPFNERLFDYLGYEIEEWKH